MGVALLKGEVHILAAEGESGQHIMVTADDDADGTVGAIIRDAQGIVLVHVWFEAKLVKTFLQTLMKWHGIGTKRNNFAFTVNLKVEMLA